MQCHGRVGKLYVEHMCIVSGIDVKRWYDEWMVRYQQGKFVKV